MSAIANLRGATAAFPPVNLHVHGHKRGGHVQATDDAGSESPAQVPPGLRQSLFGSLLNSLQQAIGVQLTVAAPAAPANSSAAGTPAAQQSSATMLQNYLNNLSHNAHTDGSAAAKSAGSNLSVSA